MILHLQPERGRNKADARLRNRAAIASRPRPPRQKSEAKIRGKNPRQKSEAKIRGTDPRHKADLGRRGSALRCFYGLRGPLTPRRPFDNRPRAVTRIDLAPSHYRPSSGAPPRDFRLALPLPPTPFPMALSPTAAVHRAPTPNYPPYLSHRAALTRHGSFLRSKTICLTPRVNLVLPR
jgi:hypothetical protein